MRACVRAHTHTHIHTHTHAHAHARRYLSDVIARLCQHTASGDCPGEPGRRCTHKGYGKCLTTAVRAVFAGLPALSPARRDCFAEYVMLFVGWLVGWLVGIAACVRGWRHDDSFVESIVLFFRLMAGIYLPACVCVCQQQQCRLRVRMYVCDS